MADAADMAQRIRATIPPAWFADDAPVLQALLLGFGTAWAACYDLLQTVIQQSRISTATDQILDLVSTDFFGPVLPRFAGEQDAAFRQRIRFELLRPRGNQGQRFQQPFFIDRANPSNF
ncbi:MAG: hypothetical protein WDN04_16795 [Rhodospirillales bacterium]